MAQKQPKAETNKPGGAASLSQVTERKEFECKE